MDLKVPFLADSQLESAATELLRKHAKWKGAPTLDLTPFLGRNEGERGMESNAERN